jgi:hypothetical protein
MSTSDQSQQAIDEFFREISSVADAYQEPSFGYLALRRDANFVIVQGTLFLNTGLSKTPFHAIFDH